MSGTIEYANCPLPELRDAVKVALLDAEGNGEFEDYDDGSMQDLRDAWMKTIGFEKPSEVKLRLEHEFEDALKQIQTSSFETDLATFLQENELDSAITFLDELARDGDFHFSGGAAAHCIVALDDAS